MWSCERKESATRAKQGNSLICRESVPFHLHQDLQGLEAHRQEGEVMDLCYLYVTLLHAPGIRKHCIDRRLGAWMAGGTSVCQYVSGRYLHITRYMSKNDLNLGEGCHQESLGEAARSATPIGEIRVLVFILRNCQSFVGYLAVS